MPFTSGFSAMVRCAAALELDPDSALETLNIKCPDNFPCGYVLEAAGTFLLYTVSIVGPEVHVAVSLLDGIGPPQVLLRSPDTEAGWETVSHLISDLEKYRVQSLERPIIVNGWASDGSDSWIIA